MECLVIRQIFKPFCTILNLKKRIMLIVLCLHSNFKRRQNTSIVSYATGDKIKRIKNPNNFQKRIQYWFTFKSELIPLNESLKMWRKSRFWSQRTYTNFRTLMHLTWNGMLKLLIYINPQKHLRKIKKKKSIPQQHLLILTLLQCPTFKASFVPTVKQSEYNIYFE